MSDEAAQVDTGVQDAGAQDAAPMAAAEAASDFTIPEGYADRKWASDLKSNDDVWKLLDNSQSLIGKRVVPADDAPDEDWNQFYKNIGRPDSPDAYEFPEIEGVPEGFDLTDFNQTAKEVMHEAGLNTRQAQKLYETYLKKELEVAGRNKESMDARSAELDKEFDELTGKIFDGKFNEVSPKAQAFIRNNLPEELMPVMDEIKDNPKALTAMIALANNAQSQIDQVKKQYGGEDSLNSGGQAGQTGKDDLLKQLTEAKIKARNADPFSPERKAAEADIEKLRDGLQRFFK